MALAQCVAKGVRLAGVVCTVPGQPLDITEVGQAFADDVERIAKTVGLRKVHRVKPGQTAGDLSVEAARLLLADLGWEPSSVDALIMVTQTPDHFLPATACIAQAKLGLADSCLAFDVGLGCSGYVYGLWMASQFVQGGTARRVLLLAGDTVGQIISPEDRSVGILFGDAGSATAMELDPGAEPMAFVLGTDGAGRSNLVIPAGGFRLRADADTAVATEDDQGNRRSPQQLYMDGLEIFNFTMKRVPPLVKEVLALQEWTSETPDYYVFHQANQFVVEKISKKLGVAMDRVPLNIAKYGNTSVVSIPLVLADDLSARLQCGEPVQLLLAGFGVGYSWAGAALTVQGVKVARVTTAREEDGCV